MAEAWLSIRVELLSGRGEGLDPAPGRDMVASPRHALAELAHSIDVAFARWDHAHLHRFVLPDGREFMPEGSDDEDEVLDSTSTELASLDLTRGSLFEYVFDLGDDWRHRCTVTAVDVDPVEVYGIVPQEPVPVWGWGTIPDQYARRSADE